MISTIPAKPTPSWSMLAANWLSCTMTCKFIFQSPSNRTQSHVQWLQLVSYACFSILHITIWTRTASPPSSIADDFSLMGRLWYLAISKRQACPYCALKHLVPIFVLYIEVYVIDKTCCKYKPNQTTVYAVILWLITNKTALKKVALI